VIVATEAGDTHHIHSVVSNWGSENTRFIGQGNATRLRFSPLSFDGIHDSDIARCPVFKSFAPSVCSGLAAGESSAHCSNSFKRRESSKPCSLSWHRWRDLRNERRGLIVMGEETSIMSDLRAGTWLLESSYSRFDAVIRITPVYGFAGANFFFLLRENAIAVTDPTFMERVTCGQRP